MRKAFLLLLFIGLYSSVFSQTNVKGKVIDKSTNESLPGATVQVDGTTVGTITNEKGEFELTAPKGSQSLIISFIGYKPQKVTVKPNMVVELDADNLNLDEVVVVGYGTMRKSDLTGSVSKVNIEDMRKVTTIDASKALQGRVAGVNVISNSGSPGAGVKVRIRGIGSVNNSDPIYVVDGFIMGDISHIAPTDIESMEVLKDASATAIYGSRGANGVILVKTKIGSKTGKMNVQASVLTGISRDARRLEMADATEFANARKQIGKTDDIINYVLDQQAAGNYLKGTDWQDEIFRQGSNARYDISVNGGNEFYSYDHGMSFSTDKGIIKGTQIDKFMFHSNNDMKLTKNVKMGMNFNYVRYEKPGDRNDFYSGTLTGALRADPISAAWDDYTNFYGEVYYSPSSVNPAMSVYLAGKNNYVGNRFTANSYLQFDNLLIKGLSFRTQFGAIMNFDDEKNYSPKYFITPTQKNDDATLYQKRYYGTNWISSNYFSYNNTFGKLNINNTLGVEFQKSINTDIWAKGYDVPETASLQYLGAHRDQIKFDLGGGRGDNSMNSAFYRGNFSWDNKYVITGTIRADGTSKFLDSKRWSYFPSFAASWNMHNESFLQPISNVLSMLKLRAGWGMVGNQASAGSFDYVSLVNSGYVYALNGLPVNGAVQKSLANEEIQWESANQLNFGVDYGLFNNQLTGSIEYFIRDTKDMLLRRPIPLYAGKEKPMVNAGTVRNSGIEFTLNYSNRKRDFKYDIGLNLSFIKNNVESLAGGDPIRSGGAGRIGNMTMTEEGHEIAYFYGYKTDGIFNTQEELDAHVKDGVAIQPNAGLGDVKFLDRNGDGKITELDMTHLGSAHPLFTGGLNVNLEYKGFDLVAFFTGSYGNEIVNAMRQSLYNSKMFETNISRDMAVNSWTPANPTSNIPRLDAADLNKNTENFSDLYVEDGSYLRLKMLQLGYSLPKSFIKKAGISNVRLYVSAENVFTLTKYTGLDPEVFGLYGNPLYYGIDQITYPQAKSFSVGLNITL